MFGAEVEHFLSLADAADHGAYDAFASGDDAKCGEVDGHGRSADKDQGAVSFQQSEVGAEVVLGGNGIDDEVEIVGVFGQRCLVLCEGEFMGAEFFGVLFFGG